MKNVVIAIIVFAFCIIPPNCFAEDDDMVWFTSKVAGEINNTSSEWYDNSLDRASLTALLCLEVASGAVENNDEILELLFNSSYVGKNGEILYVLGSTTNLLVFISYRPAEGRGSFQSFDKADYSEHVDQYIEEVMRTQCPDGFKKNNQDEISISLNNIQTTMVGIIPEAT